jgi:hypothetical protein
MSNRKNELLKIKVAEGQVPIKIPKLDIVPTKISTKKENKNLKLQIETKKPTEK